ncbi:MAG: Tat pathway signal protein [Calditrichae bacterium]|nr:Tat pathway signal protein [Calditrichia bacterium]
MKRRHFIRTLNGSLAALYSSSLGLLSCNNASSMKEKPKIWVWLRPLKNYTPELYNRLFIKMKQSGVDAILPEIYNSWGAHYQSSRHKVLDNWLETILPLANGQNLEVHGWMWSMPNNQEEYVENHRDWYVVNALGEPAYQKPAYVGYYKFMCPNHEDVRQFVSANVAEISAIEGLSGVHLDYIRFPDVILPPALQPKYNIIQDREYPQYDYCYCDRCVEKFKNQSGINIREVDDPVKNKDWKIFRQNSVTELVNNYLVPEARQAGRMITAAVFPNWENVRQKWFDWDLDAFLPMLYAKFYNGGDEWLKENIEKEVASIRQHQQINSGLFVNSYDQDTFKSAIRTSLDAGANGIALFDASALKDEHYSVLKKLYNK